MDLPATGDSRENVEAGESDCVPARFKFEGMRAGVVFWLPVRELGVEEGAGCDLPLKEVGLCRVVGMGVLIEAARAAALAAARDAEFDGM